MVCNLENFQVCALVERLIANRQKDRVKFRVEFESTVKSGGFQLKNTNLAFKNLAGQDQVESKVTIELLGNFFERTIFSKSFISDKLI